MPVIRDTYVIRASITRALMSFFTMFRTVFKTYEKRYILVCSITAPFNNMRTLKFKAQPTNAFFATVNQMFGRSSHLPTTAERMVIKSCTVQTTKQCSTVVVSLEDPPNFYLIDGSENAFVGRPLNFRVHMLLKSAVKEVFKRHF